MVCIFHKMYSVAELKKKYPHHEIGRRRKRAVRTYHIMHSKTKTKLGSRIHLFVRQRLVMALRVAMKCDCCPKDQMVVHVVRWLICKSPELFVDVVSSYGAISV